MLASPRRAGKPLAVSSLPPPADLTRLADAALGNGRVAEAIGHYRSSLARDPEQPVAWYNLGWALRASRRFDEAVAAYGEAIARGLEGSEDALVNRAAILSDHLFRADAAIEELERALRLQPRFLPALLSLGAIREDLGDAAGARQAYERAVEAAPGNGRAVARLGLLTSLAGDAAAAVRWLEAGLARAAAASDRAEILYALGEAFDQLRRYDDAFRAFEAANRIARSLSSRRYDPRRQEDLTDRLIATGRGRRPRIAARPGARVPVFICGMFRSGSTLAERMLSRHPEVGAAGELEFIPALAASLSPYPEGVDAIDGEQLQRWRDEYWHNLPDAPLVIDKRCDNFLYLGLARRLFPEARIVHTRRHPLDNLLSIYFLNFGDGVSYGHCLLETAHYYIQYRRLIAHWREAVFEDIVDLDYDQLVADPRSTLATTVAALGLAWDEALLASEADAGPVRTASAWQIRKPLHQRSSGRWRHYAKHLAEPRRLLAAAGL